MVKKEEDYDYCELIFTKEYDNDYLLKNITLIKAYIAYIQGEGFKLKVVIEYLVSEESEWEKGSLYAEDIDVDYKEETFIIDISIDEAGKLAYNESKGNKGFIEDYIIENINYEQSKYFYDDYGNESDWR